MSGSFLEEKGKNACTKVLWQEECQTFTRLVEIRVEVVKVSVELV